MSRKRSNGYDAPFPHHFSGKALYQLSLVKSSEARRFVPAGLPLVELFGRVPLAMSRPFSRRHCQLHTRRAVPGSIRRQPGGRFRRGARGGSAVQQRED